MALGSVALPAAVEAQAIDPDSALAHVRYLASDALAGREAGEAGADSGAHVVVIEISRSRFLVVRPSYRFAL